MYQWIVSAHICSILVWFAGLMTSLHILNGYMNAPTETRGNFQNWEGKVGLVMDLGAGLTLASGLFFFSTEAGRALLSLGTMHAKFTLVFLMLGLHGFIRASLGKFRRGQKNTIPMAVVPLPIFFFFAIVLLIELKPF